MKTAQQGRSLPRNPYDALGFAVRLLLLGLFCGVVLFACGDDGGTAAPPPAAAPDSGTPAPPRPIDEPAVPDDPSTAPAPTLTKIDPASAAFGSVGPVVVATGTGFVPRSVVQVDGTDLETSFDSDTRISATIPTAKLVKVGELKITVRTPKPGGGETAALPFAVENPPPEIIALSPLSIPSGSGDTKLTVVGTTLVSGSKIKFGTTEIATTFKDAEHLEGTITAALLTTSASVPVTVTSPAPGGGTSSKIAFTISNAAAKITSLTPPTGLIGGADAFELVVKGTGFATGAAILFNGTKLPTTVSTPGTELKATISPDLVNLFEIPVNVEIPPPGGGVSEPFIFKAENPVPTAASLAPATIPAGSNGTPVTLTGTNFVSATKMTIDGVVIAGTTVLGPTQIKATLTPAQLAKVGSVQIGAKTDPPGGGTSNAVALPLAVAVPKVTTIDGSNITLNSNDATITIKGTFFIAATTATAGGQPITVTYSKGDTITAVIPSSMLTKLGPIPVVVTNPGTGGGSAAPVNVNVVCDSTGVNAILKNTTDVQTFSTNFATAPLLSRFTADGACPAAFSAIVQKQPGRYSIVQNTTAAPVTLSAWADCTNDNKGAAYLALYRRPTPPASDAERLTCEGSVADGTPHASPSSGTSTTCPGLTKSNGGGITLAACERAVVHIQPFDNASTTFTPPPTLKIQAE